MTHWLLTLLAVAAGSGLGLTALVALARAGRAARPVFLEAEAESALDPLYATGSPSGWVRPQA